jgi:hypothetical protein
MRNLRYVAATLSLLSAMLGANSLAQSALETVPYTGVDGKPTCLADSNAVKIDRGQSLDGTGDWPMDCINCISHALQVTDISVVGDTGKPPAMPEWTLRHVLTEIGNWRGPGTALNDFLGTMLVEQTINGFEVEPRPDIQTVLLDPWQAAAGVSSFDALVDVLDGDQGASAADAAWSAAPFKLVTIGYRPDLVRADFEASRINAGGEGRLIFQAVGSDGFEAMLLIFEYTLPARNEAELVKWTQQYDELRQLPFGPAYNDALAAITRQFTDRNPAYAVPNNVTLGQLRTNELLVVNRDWELREFRISHAGKLEPAAVQMNPDLRFNSSPDLKTLLSYLASPEFTGTFPNTTIPWTFAGRPFLAGSSITPVSFIGSDTWLSGQPGIDRERFASTTCNGCHGGDAPRGVAFPGKEAVLNPDGAFQTGFTHVDARGRAFGRPNDTILSDFMCQSDLVARVAAFEAFRGSPASIANLLFGIGPVEAFGAAVSEDRKAGAAVVARNLARVH